VPALVAAGHAVVATTRSRAKIEGLRVLGSDAVVLDGLDAVASARQSVVPHRT
jgi:hypothetical protein